MSERIEKEDFFRRLAARVNANETTATAWVDGVVKTLGESFKAGESVTLPGFGGFYVHPESASRIFKFNPGQRLRALCWLLWTSVPEIGDLCQDFQPSLLHCRHKEIHEQNFENSQASPQ